jgi:hypothetical protein
LKWSGAIPDVAAGEELLETVVDGAGQDHAAKNLAALVGGERSSDGLSIQEPVARLEQFFACRRAPVFRANTWCRVREIRGSVGREPARQRHPEHRTKRLDGCCVTIDNQTLAAGLEGIGHRVERKRKSLDNERSQASGDAANSLNRNRFRHWFPW